MFSVEQAQFYRLTFILYSLQQVGCGAIGCEMLKNFALLGVGTSREEGLVRYKAFESYTFVFLVLRFSELSLTIPANVSSRSLNYELEDFSCLLVTLSDKFCFSVLNFMKFSETENGLSFLLQSPSRSKLKSNVYCHNFAN